MVAIRFSASAIGCVGNTRRQSGGFSWSIDTVNPLVTLTDKPPVLTNQTTASFSFSSNKPSSTYECKLDGGSFRALHEPSPLHRARRWLAHILRPGDCCRQPGPPTTYTWTVDTVAPDTTITSGATGPEQQRVGELRLHEQRSRLDLRLQSRRGRDHALRLADDVFRSRGRSAYLPSGSRGRGRERGRDSGGVLVADRRSRPGHDRQDAARERQAPQAGCWLRQSEALVVATVRFGLRPRRGVRLDERQEPAAHAGLQGQGEQVHEQALQERRCTTATPSSAMTTRATLRGGLPPLCPPASFFVRHAPAAAYTPRLFSSGPE